MGALALEVLNELTLSRRLLQTCGQSKTSISIDLSLQEMLPKVRPKGSDVFFFDLSSSARSNSVPK